MTITFRVYGIPQTKGSTKSFMRPGMRFPITTNDNPRNKAWAQTVSGEAQRNRPSSLITGPVGLVLWFYMPKPKSYPKRKELFATKRPDLDKMIRSIKDSLKGVMYHDDAQVVQLKAVKAYHDAPGVVVTVTDDFPTIGDFWL